MAAILPIAMDHADYLGDTPEAIAVEKSGIIKPGAVCVSAQQSPGVADVLRGHAAEVGARLVVEGPDFAVTARDVSAAGQVVSIRGLHGEYADLPLALHGDHQAQNAAVAIASVEAFLDAPLDVELVRRVLRQVTSPGRFEVWAGTPPVVLDAAHNPHGAAALARNLVELAPGRTIAVLAVMADKDHRAMLRELEHAVDVVVCTRNSSPRSLPAEALASSVRAVCGAARVHVAVGRVLGARPRPCPGRRGPGGPDPRHWVGRHRRRRRRRAHVGGVTAAQRVSRRKFSMSRTPCSLSTDSGWNCTPCNGRCRCRTPITTDPRSASRHCAVTTSSAGTRVAASEW